MSKGFTLIELMIVIAVIGILSGIALVSLTGLQKQARDSQRKSDLRAYNLALQKFYNDYSYFPGSNYGADPTFCTRRYCGDMLYAASNQVSYNNSIFSAADNGNPLIPNFLPKVLVPPSATLINNTQASYWTCTYPPFSVENPSPAAGTCFYNYRSNANRGFPATTYVIQANLEIKPTNFANSDGAMFYIKYDGETGISKDWVLTP